jgi:hypothetical protein
LIGDRQRDSVVDPAVHGEPCPRPHTEVKAGHLSMISQPDAITKMILKAAQSVSG